MKGEIVPAQRRGPDTRAAMTAGDFALRPAVALEEVTLETVDTLTLDPVDIPAQEEPLHDTDYPAETPTDRIGTQEEASEVRQDPTDTDREPNSTTFGREDPKGDVWDLVDRAQGGDSQAYAEIYRRYLDTVFRFICFRVGNRQVAEDLVAETFLRGYRRINSVTWQGRDLGAWFVTIARNLVADYFKSGRYRFEVATGDALDSDDTADTRPYANPEEAVLEHITNLSLLGALQRLSPEQRDCIVLRFLKGYSVAETAMAMDKNEGAVKALQYRAIRAMQRLLPEGFIP